MIESASGKFCRRVIEPSSHRHECAYPASVFSTGQARHILGERFVNGMAQFSGSVTKIIFKTLIYKKKTMFAILNGNIAGKQIDNMIEVRSGNIGPAAGFAFWRLFLICHDPIQKN